jgi:isopentenyl diphosphate isomerase/L-lactate dehydrogenase-like FMN-dependent dehydrogenase
MALAEVVTGGESPAVTETGEPSGRQLKIDGMPVAQFRVQITGGVTVTEDVLKAWRLGKAVELTVAGVVSSRRDKAETNFGKPTGDVIRSVVLHVHDIVTDDEDELG